MAAGEGAGGNDAGPPVVVIVDAGPLFYRRPMWAYGPFPNAAVAERWVAESTSRWAAVSGGWDHRVVPAGAQGALRIQAPASLPPGRPDHR